METVCAPQTEPCWERNLVLTYDPQAKLRLEMEMERMRQTHSKEMESRDEEVEEARQSCQKKVWHLSSFQAGVQTCSFSLLYSAGLCFSTLAPCNILLFWPSKSSLRTQV